MPQDPEAPHREPTINVIGYTSAAALAPPPPPPLPAPPLPVVVPVAFSYGTIKNHNKL